MKEHVPPFPASCSGEASCCPLPSQHWVGVGRERAPGDRVGRLLPPTITLSRSLKPAFCLLFSPQGCPVPALPATLSQPRPQEGPKLSPSDLALLVSFQVPISFYGRCLQDCGRRWLWGCRPPGLPTAFPSFRPLTLPLAFQLPGHSPDTWTCRWGTGQSPGLPSWLCRPGVSRPLWAARWACVWACLIEVVTQSWRGTNQLVQSSHVVDEAEKG